MEHVRADSHQHLRQLLAAMDLSVPTKMQDRENYHVEMFCAAHLLSTLPEARLSFPLVLNHRDRPDFELALATVDVGIEHTQAVPENVARAQAMRDEGLGGDTYFEPHAEPGEPRKSAKRLRKEIEDDEPSDGWVGDGSPLWARVILEGVRQKVAKAQKPGFHRFPLNWLLIYDNWPNPGVKVEKAALLLAPLLLADRSFDTFDNIFVIRGDRMVEFSATATAAYNVVGPRAGV
jgi:hypothetical protein